MGSPRQEADSDSLDAIEHFLDEIVENVILELGVGFQKDISDFDGDYLHENVTDRSYRPREAVDILEDLHEFEETDSGLWEGAEDWRRILETIAAYTYSNAVASMFSSNMENLESEFSGFPFTYEDLLENKAKAEGEGQPVDHGVFEGDPLSDGPAKEAIDQFREMSEEERDALEEKYKEALPDLVKAEIKRWIASQRPE